MSEHWFELTYSTQPLQTSVLGPGDVFEMERGSGHYAAILQMDDPLERVTLWARIYPYGTFTWAPVYRVVQRELLTLQRIAEELPGQPLPGGIVAYLMHREARDREAFASRPGKILTYPELMAGNGDGISVRFCANEQGALHNLPHVLLCWGFGNLRLVLGGELDALQVPKGQLSQSLSICDANWTDLSRRH